MGEDEHAAVAVGGELEAVALDVPGPRDQPRRLQRRDAPGSSAGLELLAGGRRPRHVGDEPAGELVRRGDGAPHALDRMAEAALEAQGGAAVDGVLGCGHRGVLLQVLFEGVEALRPVAAVGLEPAGDLGQRLGAQPVPAALAVRADLDEPGLAQHLEVLGDAGLAEVEARDEVAGGPLAVAQQVEDLASGRFGERRVGGHRRSYYQLAI